MTREKFEKLVKEGIRKIPQEFLDEIDNVGIVIEDDPTPEQKKKLDLKEGYFLFGLYEGIPRTERWGYADVIPDKITIFKKQIEEAAGSDEEIRKIVKETVWHEIAHHFGMDEKQVREAEKRC
ncbi:MAG: metallopeptidase family protein [Geobacteraceae bacterium]|nr:metallopeptidase family protein [Geobacteraceae bacterium]